VTSEMQKKLLTEIFDSDSKTVNSKRFRVKHAKLRDQIDLLVKSGFIKTKEEQNTAYYSLSLLGLNEVGSPEANIMIESMKKLFLFMKDCYMKDPDESISYSDLASKLDMSINDIHQFLQHMIDVPIWSSWSSNPTDVGSTNILLSESILDYDSFQNAVDQQVEWGAKRLEQASGSSSPRNFLRDGFGRFRTQGSNIGSHQKLKWPSCVPDKIRPILNEISTAFEHQLFALAVMGLRTVIDLVGNDVAEDKPFKKKLSELVSRGYLTASQRDNLESVLNAGHATIHRGFIPTHEDAEMAAEIVYHLLVSVYGEQHKEKLDQSIPKRKNQS